MISLLFFVVLKNDAANLCTVYVFVKCFTHRSQHDPNNEPSEGPDADEGGGTAAGDLGQSPRRTQEDGQKARLQQLTLPTCTDHHRIIGKKCFSKLRGNVQQKSKEC